MRVLKSKEAIFKALPPLSQEDLKEMNRQFTAYLFFKDHRKDGFRECWCSSCGEHFNYEFLKRTETTEHYEFISKRHNEWSVCPKCGRPVQMKETYRARECKNLGEWKLFVIPKPKGKNTVFLICLYAVKNYSGRNYLTEPGYCYATICYITPGYVRQFKRAYDYTFLGLRNNDFYEPKSIIEPFTKTYCYNWSALDKRGYEWIGINRLKDTFLKYAPIGKFYKAYEIWLYKTRFYNCIGECPEVKFLAYYALYPGIEKLLKIGLSDFVCSLIDGKPMKRYIDWAAETPKEMFHMNRAEFNEFRKNYYSLEDFKIYQELHKIKKNILYSQAADIVKKFGYEASDRLIRAVKKHGLNLTHTLNYLDKKTPKKRGKKQSSQDFSHTATVWTDYLDFAESLKYDLKRGDVVFPKKLQEAHDNASKALVIIKDAEQFEKYKKRYEKLRKMYEFSDGVYQIVIPTGINDIVEEGKILSHCVGGYAERHVRGATTIVFMRKCSAPEERYVTIEVRDNEKRICQNHGYKDRPVTEAEQAFIDKWIAWVKAGSKKEKNKKNAENAA